MYIRAYVTMQYYSPPPPDQETPHLRTRTSKMIKLLSITTYKPNLHHLRTTGESKIVCSW